MTRTRLFKTIFTLILFLLFSGCSRGAVHSLPSVLPVSVPVPLTEETVPLGTLSTEVSSDPADSVAAEEIEDIPDLIPDQTISYEIDHTESSPETVPASLDEEKESYFTIQFLDVGQADAALISCDNEFMMIDCGNTADSSYLYSILKEQDIPALDVLLVTHGHEDHCGGAAAVLNALPVERILCSTNQYDSKAFFNFLKYAGKQDVTVEIPVEGDSFLLGSATVDILSCNIGSDENSNSIVTKITYGDTSFLMTGDAERDAEEHLLEAGSDLSCTVLKVGHHGSRYASIYPFLREAMPEYAVISVGNDNEYGHPTDDTLSRLRDCGAKVYRTDMQGTITMTSDGTEVTVLTERGADLETIPIK